MVTLLSVAGSHLCSLTFGPPEQPSRFQFRAKVPSAAWGGRGWTRGMVPGRRAVETILLAAQAERDERSNSVGSRRDTGRKLCCALCEDLLSQQSSWAALDNAPRQRVVSGRKKSRWCPSSSVCVFAFQEELFWGSDCVLQEQLKSIPCPRFQQK